MQLLKLADCIFMLIFVLQINFLETQKSLNFSLLADLFAVLPFQKHFMFNDNYQQVYDGSNRVCFHS